MFRNMILGGQAFKLQTIEEQNVAEGLVNRGSEEHTALTGKSVFPLKLRH